MAFDWHFPDYPYITLKLFIYILKTLLNINELKSSQNVPLCLPFLSLYLILILLLLFLLFVFFV